MKKIIPFLMLGAALSLTACSSEGPGEIGTKADIVVRNAGDPPAPPKASEAAVDPVVAAHQKAVEEAAPEIEQQAEADTDTTPVPGEPQSASAAAPQEDTFSPPALERVEDAKPMEGTPMVELKPMQGTPMKEPLAAIEQQPVPVPVPAPAPSSAPLAEEPPQEHVQEPAPAPAPAPQPLAGQPSSSPQASIYPQEDFVVAQPPAAVRTGRVPNPDAALITAAQSALSAKGYYFGAADGRIGAEFLNALYLYQNAHKLTQTGITYEVLEKLGVSTAGY